jgi:DeoR/GlpR family transcriptional regulator of sugar metabolism
MIKKMRQKRILSILQSEGVVDLSELCRVMPEVSRVTLRRDIAELAEAGALKRTHGGAVLPDDVLLRADTPARLVASDKMVSQLEGLDAIILPPISGRGSDALRRQIGRSGIPFLAESAPQAGGIYLGPDNDRAARELGGLAGHRQSQKSATVLLVCHPELANTRARSVGFEAGYRAACSGEVKFIRVNGQGSYKSALRVALDAFKTNEDISVVFGVNDHSTLAGLDAAERAGLKVAAYATGGENPDFVARLADDGPLKAVAAFFPEIVGARGIDLIADALAGRALPDPALTPHAIITGDSLEAFYAARPNGWSLRADRMATLMENAATSPRRPDGRGKRVGFMPHYPAHDWYRTMIQSMGARAAGYGLELIVSPPHQGIAAEISRLRRELARTALSLISPGQTIILDDGEATLFLADELRRLAFHDGPRLAGVTVITNALDILFRLGDAPHLKVILTSGEYQKSDRCLVGPSLGALFERMRADIAFVSVAGVSPGFGLSALDERLALAGSRFVEAARRTIALADHTAIGADANYRIARPGQYHEVITDDGALPADRQSLRAAGVEVLVAGEADYSKTSGETKTSRISGTSRTSQASARPERAAPDG